jgi:hypothetical protein
LLPGIFFVLLSLLYAWTLCPTVSGGDSGELIATAYTLSTPHPPGYPLYTLLANGFTHWPWGSIASRVGMLSVLCNALAATVMGMAVRRVTGSGPAAFFSASAFALMPLSWRYAVTTDVFALNNLFVAGLLYSTAALQRRWDNTTACGCAGLMGLGLSNHQTFIFFVLPAMLWIAVQSWQRPAPRTWSTARLSGIASVCFGAGLLPYLAMPWLYDSLNLLSWGDLRTVPGWLRHVLRQEYGTFHLNAAGDVPEASPFFSLVHLYCRDLFYGTLGCVPLGCAAVLLRSPQKSSRGVHSWAMLWSLSGLFYAVVFFNLADLPTSVPVHREMQSRFWLQLHLVLCALAGVGAQRLWERCNISPKAIPWALCGLSATQLLQHYGAADASQDTFLQNVAQQTLEPLPHNALVLTRGEHLFNPLRYVQSCERLRPDVLLLSVELMHAPWYREKVTHADPHVIYPGSKLVERAVGAAHLASEAFGLEEFLQKNLQAGRRIFQCDHNSIVPALLRQQFSLQPFGLCQEINFSTQVSGESKSAESELRLRTTAVSLALFDALQKHTVRTYRPESWEQVMQAQVVQAEATLASHMLVGLPQKGQLSAPQVALLQRAIALYDTVQKVSPLQPALLKNLGVGYARLFEATGAVEARAGMRQAFSQYLQAPVPQGFPSDPERQTIEALLRTP